MNTARTRRELLSTVGQGMLVVSVGAQLAGDLGLFGKGGLARASAAENELSLDVRD